VLKRLVGKVWRDEVGSKVFGGVITAIVIALGTYLYAHFWPNAWRVLLAFLLSASPVRHWVMLLGGAVVVGITLVTWRHSSFRAAAAPNTLTANIVNMAPPGPVEVWYVDAYILTGREPERGNGKAVKARALRFSNKARANAKNVGTHVAAHLTYHDSDGVTRSVMKGCWLDEESDCVHFRVDDVHDLLLLLIDEDIAAAGKGYKHPGAVRVPIVVEPFHDFSAGNIEVRLTDANNGIVLFEKSLMSPCKSRTPLHAFLHAAISPNRRLSLAERPAPPSAFDPSSALRAAVS
jgi:hypothetical protein